MRGEDSFVRAQWAARPFAWHIYPQAQGAHWVKLSAFLARYTAADFLTLVERHRIPWYEKTLGQLFCEGAGAAKRNTCQKGKFQGMTARITPSGSKRT